MTLKDKLYLKNLKESNFNLTETYDKTYPNSSKETANAHCTDQLRAVVKRGGITIDSLIEKSNGVLKEFLDSKSVKIEKKAPIAVALTTKSMTSKTENTNKTDLTPESKDYIRGLITNRLDTPQ